jgi:hypothetical protein
MFFPSRKPRHFSAKSSVVAGCSILLLLLTAAVSARADERVAMLHPVGAVSLNDVAVARAMPVFVGDRIKTGDGASATIIAEGTQVTLPADSAVVYMQHEILVLQNTAVISTLKGMAVRSGAFKISPDATAASHFEVARGNSGVSVTATTGSLSIDDGTGSVELSAGNTFSRNAESSSIAGAKSGPIIPSTANRYEFFGDNKGGHPQPPPPPPPPPCPPRRCQRPPESPSHPCDPRYDPDHCCHDQGHGGGQGSGGGQGGGGGSGSW